MPQAFTRYAIIAMVVFGILAAVYTCGSATDASRGANKLEKLATGEMARIDFAFKGAPAPTDVFFGPDGQDMTIADLKGKVIVLNIWATWCGPCEKEMPSLAALENARGSDMFEVVALSIDELKERDYAKGQLQRLSGGALDFYQSKDLEILKPLKVDGFPTTIIYDKRGLEIARFRGDADWASYEAIGFLDEVLRQNGWERPL